MDEKEKGLAFLGCFLGPMPFVWFIVAKFTYGIDQTNGKYLLPYLIKHTFSLWPLWSSLIFAAVVGIGIFAAVIIYDKNRVYRGERFKRVLRGTKLVRASELSEKTRERNTKQLTIASIPVPIKLENLHFSIGGTTGAGKTTVLNEIIHSSLGRNDKRIILDPNGGFLSNFYRPGDKILNPYDARTEGWSFFNEIKQEYDFMRFSKSIIQKSDDSGSEEWLGYGRLIFRVVSSKLFRSNIKPTMREVFHYTNEVEEEVLKEYVAGTDAAGLFTGNDRATASARFVLSDKLPAHFDMPDGDFSLREWLNDGKPGTLFITWQEEMKDALRPLISCWLDCIFSIVLGMGHRKESEGRIIVTIDELESLDKLPTLSDGLTKGRKSGLCVFAGYQSISQIIHVYGQQVAETILSTMRTSVVMAGGQLGQTTLEHQSKSLGEIEGYVRRKNEEPGKAGKHNNTVITARAVTTTEIADLPDLSGYLAFPGKLPVAKFKTDFVEYVRKTPVPGLVLRD